MNDPYQILGVTGDSTEAEIRAAYLQKVRDFPPDRAPERFAEIRAAYDEVRDPANLRDQRLLALSDRDSIAKLATDIRARLIRADLPTESLLLLAEGP